MNALISIYSQFTLEALLVQLLIILSLSSSLLWYWISSRRKYGATPEKVPASIVQVHLNQLIQEAEVLRSQLFGLSIGNHSSERISTTYKLSEVSPVTTDHSPQTPSSSASVDASPIDSTKLKELEAQLKDKENYIASIVADRSKLEEELAAAKQSSQGANLGNTDASTQQLAKRIQELEGRLEEYSIIEDDLANIKKLQQENESLRKQLKDASERVSQAPAAATPAPTVESSAKTEAAPQRSEAEIAALSAELDARSQSLEAAAVSDSLEQNDIDALFASAPMTAASPTPESQNFEALVDKVEESLTPSPVAPSATESTPAESILTQMNETPIKPGEDDLLAEFEKMLK